MSDSRIDAVKQAAAGHWPEILERVGGIPAEYLDGRHHPCLKCGGTDRFRAFTDGSGGVYCNKCFDRENGDGLSTLQWCLGIDFPAALKTVAEYLGIAPSANGHTKRLDPLEALSRAKHVSVDALKTYGAKIDGLAVAFPMYGADGKQCSTFTIWPNGSDKQQKGMNEKGKPAGVFLPHVDGKPRLPTPGQTWLVVEGCKDSAALQSLGYPAVGMSTKQLGKSFSPMFGGVDVTIIPDRDEAGEQGSNKTAARLRGHAASIKIAILPAEFTAQNGADVRDVLKLTDGETLVRDAIDNAKPWQPPTLEATAEDIPTIMQPDGRTEAVNARRFAARFGDVVRWCDPWQKWLVWDGRRWAIDDRRRIDALAKDVGAALWQDMATAALTAEQETMRAMMGYCKASNSGNGIRNMLALARSEPNVPILPNVLDSDPWLLNVANGTIGLRSSDQRAHYFRPHDRADFIT